MEIETIRRLAYFWITFSRTCKHILVAPLVLGFSGFLPWLMNRDQGGFLIWDMDAHKYPVFSAMDKLLGEGNLHQILKK